MFDVGSLEVGGLTVGMQCESAVCLAGPGRLRPAVAVQQGGVAARADGLRGLLRPGLHDARHGLLHVLHHLRPLQP